ncbi:MULTISPECIES: thiosulfate reductase PhsA [unclassified Shewanella]|jgi:thiosulfate reductase/polysulfide reductase chain A|uniref:thiosulfate reductase PhsA n=1 Tax=unclassified Shewanella TaxID=196818 RepID=UPI000C3238DB|nr:MULTISPECIES: thiosulfate reductase PhsA [unclassified Shewanella]MBB1363060.1 thiosulfate reductase PhsA [Shewanella sp. SR44-4]PKH28957.1 thiosulfate reductase PhsA [Shewanella sp. ALD9]
MIELNRRHFLKGAGASGATCALASMLPGSLAALEKSPLKGVASEVASICEMCSTRCPIKARIVDGKNVFITGNKEAKSFGGKVCARGGAGHSLLYDPQRIVNPLKRVGERGAGEWAEISWADAYKEIAAKMNQIKQQYGAETIAFSSKSGSLSDHIFHLAEAFGSPNTFTHASTCPGSYVVAAKAIFGTKMKRDLSNAKYIINFGHNLYEGINMSETRGLMQAQMDRGAKLVVFEPRFSIVADKADEWHAIRPGTDVAVALALCHVLINDNLYDHDFIEKYVVGFDEFAAEVQKYTPEWAETISDVSASAIRRIAHEYASHAPHAVVDFGHRATFTPEEFDMRRALYAANILIGNIERKGGIYMGQKAPGYNKLAGENVAPALAKPGVKGMPKPTAIRIDQVEKQYAMMWSNGGIYQTILDATLDAKPYQLKAWVMSRTNPMQTLTDRAKVEQSLKKLDLVVSCDLYISETAAYADYILPESTYLERDEEIQDKSGKNPAYYVRQRVVETIGNTRPSWQIFKELGQALGLEQFYPWDNIETLQLMQLNRDHSLLEHIKKMGYVSYGKPLMLREPEMVTEFVKAYPNAKSVDADGTYASSMSFKTPSGKIELTSPKIEGMAPGRGVIKHRDVQLKQADELYFIQGKVAVHTNGATHNIPMLANLMSKNAIWIHPITAGRLDIHSGDAIRLTSSVGSEEGTALVTPGIRQDTVFAYMGFGSKNKELVRATGKGIHCGNLLPNVIAPICGMNLHTTGVKLVKI